MKRWRNFTHNGLLARRAFNPLQTMQLQGFVMWSNFPSISLWEPQYFCLPCALKENFKSQSSHPIARRRTLLLQNGQIEPRFQVCILHYVQIFKFHKHKTKISGPNIWSFAAGLFIAYIREGLPVSILH